MLASKEKQLSLATTNSIKKNVQILTQAELLDFIERRLKEKRIVSINNLFKHLKDDALDKDFELKSAYLRYMQLELAKKPSNRMFTTVQKLSGIIYVKNMAIWIKKNL